MEDRKLPKKYYAVRKGRKIGIYNTWEECRKNIDRYPGTEFKSFATRIEAENYINDNDNINSADYVNNANGGITRDEALEKSSTIVAYVDGSYNGSDTEFSYGMVILEGDEEYQFCKKIKDESLAKMRNVAGEIAGAMAAMEYAVSHDKKRVIIYHDYEGIAKWCLGEWKTNKEGTIAYKKYYDEVIKKVAVEFIKVKGHSNDKYNDMADELAKRALDE